MKSFRLFQLSDSMWSLSRIRILNFKYGIWAGKDPFDPIGAVITLTPMQLYM